MNEDDKREQLEKILRDISCAVDPETLNQKYDLLKKIYTDYRHLYSSLFPIVADLFKEDLDGGCIYLQENIKVIYQKIPEDRAHSRFRKSMRKLYDHIVLEIVRLQWSIRRHEQIEKTLDDLQKQQESIAADYSRLQKLGDELTTKVEEAQKNTRSIQLHFVGILGIFAAIVIGASGSVSYSNSVFSNLLQSTPKQLFLAGILHLALLANLLYFFSQLILTNKDSETTICQLRDWITALNMLLLTLSYTIVLLTSLD